MQWHEERDVQKENRSCFRGFFLSRVRYILPYIYIHTYILYTYIVRTRMTREKESGELGTRLAYGTAR